MLQGLKKIRELRPAPCGTRVGDIVEIAGKKHLQVKCRKCSKQQGKEVYHYVPLDNTI